MWLINTTTLKLELVPGPETHPYAILSHTWQAGQEITFQDFTAPDRDLDDPRFTKIRETCRLAREHVPPLGYAWVDTCCINKTSSAELTEAINSMFWWYVESSMCFVYLCDYPALPSQDRSSDDDKPRDLHKCAWFRRGWTLQELIAPTRVDFYDQAWKSRGSKRSDEWLAALSRITGIDEAVLINHAAPSVYPVAVRMAWASERITSREEDMAYCLFGLFDIHLPLIYGEGRKAFVRLQEAIAQETNDLSLFAWKAREPRGQKYWGMFARSPADFDGCLSIRRYGENVQPDQEFTITNKGLRFVSRLSTSRDLFPYRMKLYLDLRCVNMPDSTVPGGERIFIQLAPTGKGYVREGLWGGRVDSKPRVARPRDSSFKFDESGSIKADVIYAPKLLSWEDSLMLSNAMVRQISVTIDNKTTGSGSTLTLCRISRGMPAHLWEPLNGVFLRTWETPRRLSESNVLGLLEMELLIKPRSDVTRDTPCSTVYVVLYGDASSDCGFGARLAFRQDLGHASDILGQKEADPYEIGDALRHVRELPHDPAARYWPSLRVHAPSAAPGEGSVVAKPNAVLVSVSTAFPNPKEEITQCQLHIEVTAAYPWNSADVRAGPVTPGSLQGI